MLIERFRQVLFTAQFTQLRSMEHSSLKAGRRCKILRRPSKTIMHTFSEKMGLLPE